MFRIEFNKKKGVIEMGTMVDGDTEIHPGLKQAKGRDDQKC